MAHYSRFWPCKVCGKRQESESYPDVEVCDVCSAEPALRRSYGGLVEQGIDALLRRAYERGFKHGAAATSSPEEADRD